MFNMLFMPELHPSFTRLVLAAKEIKKVTSLAEIARGLGVSDQNLNGWKSRGLPLPSILDIAAWVGCDPYWLRDGTGNMHGSMEGINYEVRHVMQQMLAMEPEQQYTVRKVVDVLTESAPKDPKKINEAESLTARVLKASGLIETPRKGNNKNAVTASYSDKGDD